MSASKLVKPAARYKDSFLEALKEYHTENMYSFLDYTSTSENFEDFINDLNAGKRFMHRDFESWVEPVPETVLWFVKDDHYLGSVNIRHRLNWHLEKWGGHMSFNIRPSMRGKGFGRKILQKAMPCSCFLGIDKAMITINPAHKAAIAIVEQLGGEHIDQTPDTDQFPSRVRYWLQCN